MEMGDLHYGLKGENCGHKYVTVAVCCLQHYLEDSWSQDSPSMNPDGV